MKRRILLAILPLALAGCPTSGPTTPDAAYSRLQSAIASGDDLRSIRACEDYLTWVRVPDPNPARTGQVRIAYKQAFVRWVSGAAPGEAQAARRIERFGKLLGGADAGGSGQ